MTREENSKLSSKQYQQGAETLDSKPRVVYIETTNTCNLACPMCPITMGVESFMGKSKLFAWELLERLRPFLEVADRCIMSGGGEPFLHPRFPDMIRMVKSAGADVIFNTNGTLMDENAAKMLVELQADTVSFSVDAADPQTYSRIRVGADLSDVERNVARLVRLKKEAGSERPFLNLQMTLMKENLDEVAPLVEMAASWGIRHMVVEPLTPVFEESPIYADYVKKNAVEEARALPSIRAALERAGELGIIFSSHYLVMGGDEPPADLDAFSCAQPWINFGVRADGRIFPCCGTSRTMGDLSTSEATDIWNGEEYRRFRRTFASKQSPAECNLCIKEGRAMFFNADLVEQNG